jgi:hypothetical protein
MVHYIYMELELVAQLVWEPLSEYVLHLARMLLLTLTMASMSTVS